MDVSTYVKHGFTLIPCRPRDKVAAVPWGEYRQRKPTGEELESWFGNGKQFNPAIVTGQASGIIVLDVDGPDGAKALEGKELPATPCVKTAKGIHYYYRWPGRQVRNFARRLPGIDLRGDGGYVLCPPAIHPSGATYEWSISPDEAPLAEAPAWLLSLLEPEKPRQAPLEGDAIPQGERDTTLASLAGVMRAKGFTQAAIEAALKAENQQRCRPPLDTSQVEKIARSISRYDPAKAVKVRVDGRVYTLDELLAEQFPDPVWVISELLPVGLCILAGKPKLGKSWLALQLALSVATGGKFFGHDVQRRKVLYYALEDSPRRLKSRLEKMQATAGEMTLRFGIQGMGTPEGLDFFWRGVDDAQAELVIIDTLTRAFSNTVKDWNDVGQTTEALSYLQNEAMDRNACIMFVDHHRKGAGTEADAVVDVIGSTGKSAVSDVLWGLYRERGKSTAKLQVTGRDIMETDIPIDFDFTTGCWQRTDEEETDTAQARIMNAIIENGGRITTSELSTILGKDLGNTNRALQELTAQGYLRRGQRIGHEIPYFTIQTCKDDNTNNDTNLTNILQPTAVSL